MITKFGCQNIKAIQNFDAIEIRPITIIMGENSSGKSSILQALSFLSFNSVFKNNLERIKYNNPFSEFGTNNSFKDINKDVVLFFEIYENYKKYSIELLYKDEIDNNEYGYLYEVYIKNYDEQYEYRKKYKDIAISVQDLGIYYDDLTISKRFSEIFSILELNLNSIRHIGKLKDKNETYDYNLDYIGYFGENFKQRAMSLNHTGFIKKAIQDIFNYDLVIDKRKQELFINLENKKLELSMFGTSISSTIPILTQFALNRQKNTKNKYRLTIVEEPELNLHPKSQARFTETVFKNIIKNQTIIIETHSDHIINKLASLISSKKVKPKDVIIYYKTKNSFFQKIEFNKCGRFVDGFPNGFFDATLDDIYSLGTDC